MNLLETDYWEGSSVNWGWRQKIQEKFLLFGGSGGAIPGCVMTWLEDPPPWLKPWLRPAYCFASVIVWTEDKNVTISDRFICFILTVKRRWRPVFWGRQLKKVVNIFWGQQCIGMIWLENFLTSKWPGSYTALAPPLLGGII